MAGLATLGGTTNPTYIVMDADKTVTATFVELPPVDSDRQYCRQRQRDT